MWQGQEGCEVIASIITVTVCNLALTVYLISSLSFERCLIIACALQFFSCGLTFKNNEAVETERSVKFKGCLGQKKWPIGLN